MNIFTKIKYPVDITFRIEDLERIPATVLEVWWAHNKPQLYGHENRQRIPCNSARIHAYLNNSTRKDVRRLMLKKLNELLEDWEELNQDYIAFIKKHTKNTV